MNSLQKIAEKYDCCKAHNSGFFAKIYEQFLENHRNDTVTIAEIGVFYGASIKMWNDYFPNATIYGIDHFTGVNGNGYSFPDPMKFPNEVGNNPLLWSRVRLLSIDQSNREQLKKILDIENDFFFVLDDGSHIPRDQIIGLGMLFKKIQPGGYYFIEDLVPESASFLHQYISSKKFPQSYLTEEEKVYLDENVDSIKIFENSHCITSVIRKKIQDNHV